MHSIFKWQLSGRENSSESGVVAAAVALVAVVLLTIGLSQGAQVAQDLFISDQEAESTRVFNAAESGIEDALSQEALFAPDAGTQTINPNVSEGIDSEVTVTPQNSLTTRVVQGDTASVKVNGAGSLQIDWSDFGVTGCNAAALLISIYKTTGGATDVRYLSAAPTGCSLAARVEDGFNTANVTALASGNFAYRYSLSTVAGDELVLIKPLYQDTSISVSGSSSIQAHLIRSESETSVAAGDDSQQHLIQALRTMPRAPRFLEYAVYSNGSVQH